MVVVSVGVVLAVALANASYLLFVVPCAIMKGAMSWMMAGGQGGGFGGGKR